MPFSSDSPGRPEAGAGAALAREGRALARYLLGAEPDGYAVTAYVTAHRSLATAGATGFDLALVRFAAAGPGRARIADAYTRIFRPRGLLRRKLILAVAILENTAAHHRHFTAGGTGSRLGAVARLAGAGLGFALALAAGILLLGPRHLAAGRGAS